MGSPCGRAHQCPIDFVDDADSFTVSINNVDVGFYVGGHAYTYDKKEAECLAENMCYVNLRCIRIVVCRPSPHVLGLTYVLVSWVSPDMRLGQGGNAFHAIAFTQLLSRYVYDMQYFFSGNNHSISACSRHKILL